jgi:hypothetical protein
VLDFDELGTGGGQLDVHKLSADPAGGLWLGDTWILVASVRRARVSGDGRSWREAATDSGSAPLPVLDCNLPEVQVAQPGTSARAASRISRAASAFVRNRSAASSRTLRTTARTYAPWVG